MKECVSEVVRPIPNCEQIESERPLTKTWIVASFRKTRWSAGFKSPCTRAKIRSDKSLAGVDSGAETKASNSFEPAGLIFFDMGPSGLKNLAKLANPAAYDLPCVRGRSIEPCRNFGKR